MSPRGPLCYSRRARRRSRLPTMPGCPRPQPVSGVLRAPGEPTRAPRGRSRIARFALLLLLALVDLARPAPAVGAPDPEAVAGRDVAAIRFEGLRRVDDATVRLVLGSRQGRPLSLAQVAEDLRAVYGMGFFRDVQVYAEPTSDGQVELVFVLSEKPAVRAVEVVGNEGVSDDDIEEIIDIRPFTILDEAKVGRNRQKIADLYSEQGYYLAEVEQSIERVSADEVDVVFTVLENAKIEVRSVSFVGNQAVPDEVLEGSIATREGNLLSFLTDAGTYKKTDFEIDLLRIQSVYYDRGYVNVRVDTPDVEISADRKYVYITIRVEEGEQFRVGEVGVTGDTDVVGDPENLLIWVSTKEGEVFNRSKLGEDLEALKTTYENLGYAYANVTPLTSVDPETRTIDISFDIQKGSKVYYERIDIVGNTKTRDKVIRRELRIYEGELTSATLRDISERRVNALGFFETVEIRTRRGSADDLQIAEVEIKEKATGTFQVGAGFSSAENFIATAQIQQDNFLGRGQTLQLSAQISSLRQLFQVRFTEPYFLDTEVTLSLNAFNTETQFRSFLRSATGGDVTVGYPITDDIRAFMTYSLEFVQSRGSDGGFPQPTLFSLNNSGRISSLRGTLTYDTRNNRLFPSQGMFHSFSAEFSESFLGASDNRTFQRYRGFLRFYKPLPLGAVGKISIRGGLLNSTATQDLSPSEKFILGGINSLRGYLPFTVGPESKAPINDEGSERLDQKDVSTVFIEGGNKEIVINAELEIPVFQEVGIRGVLFLDAGNVYAEEENFFYAGGPVRGSACRDGQEITFNDGRQTVCRNAGFDPRDLPLGLLWSVGFGFRWFSPIGPLRFEWGIPLTRRPTDDPGPLFEFSIGNSF